MLINKLFSQGKKERRVTDQIQVHLRLLTDACDVFHRALVAADQKLLRCVADMERQGDIIRREIIAAIYAGAFLPYLRPDLCKFIHLADDVFDRLQEAADCCLQIHLPEALRADCLHVAYLNRRVCELLTIAYQAMLDGVALREKTLGIRVYEKKIDDIKFGLLQDLREVPVDNYWEGHLLAGFVAGLTGISDAIEDAGDQLEVIHVCMH